MSRKKRSEKIGAGVAVRPAPAPGVAPPKVAERIIGGLCPVCGRLIPAKRAIKAGWVTVDHIGYFDNIEWDSAKPFGVSFEAGGRGSFNEWDYISPEEAPELFEAMRNRLKEAVKEWVEKGWLTKEEV